MTIEEVFDEYPVLYVLAHALEVARAAAIKEWYEDGDNDIEEETFDYFDIINDKAVNETMNRLEGGLFEPAWRIIRDCHDFDLIRFEMGEMEAWPRNAGHAIRLVCLYGVCVRLNQKMIEEAGLSAHERMSIRAKEAVLLAKANVGQDLLNLGL